MFVGGGWEPDQKKKGDSVCGFIGVRWRRVGNPTETKAKISPTFHTFTGLLHLNELSVDLGCCAGKRVRPISCEQKTGRQTVLLYRYRCASYNSEQSTAGFFRDEAMWEVAPVEGCRHAFVVFSAQSGSLLS